jgi:YD repeat-containing protein
LGVARGTLSVERFELMIPPICISTCAFAAIFLFAPVAFTQIASPTENDALRVNVTINPDESRTVYEFDPPHHKATATTTERDGKLRGKVLYELDDTGRFASGRIFGPDGRFRFKSLYKYDSAGRLQEETQRGNDDTLLAKIVYSYDSAGKQTGYSIFDASGKLIGRTSPPTPTPTSSAKPHKSRP